MGHRPLLPPRLRTRASSVLPARGRHARGAGTPAGWRVDDGGVGPAPEDVACRLAGVGWRGGNGVRGGAGPGAAGLGLVGQPDVVPRRCTGEAGVREVVLVHQVVVVRAQQHGVLQVAGPSSRSHQRMWWTSQYAAGTSQPFRAHARSRMITARRSAADDERVVRPRSSGTDSAPRTMRPSLQSHSIWVSCDIGATGPTGPTGPTVGGRSSRPGPGSRRWGSSPLPTPARRRRPAPPRRSERRRGRPRLDRCRRRVRSGGDPAVPEVARSARATTASASACAVVRVSSGAAPTPARAVRTSAPAARADARARTSGWATRTRPATTASATTGQVRQRPGLIDLPTCRTHPGACDPRAPPRRPWRPWRSTPPQPARRPRRGRGPSSTRPPPVRYRQGARPLTARPSFAPAHRAPTATTAATSSSRPASAAVPDRADAGASSSGAGDAASPTASAVTRPATLGRDGSNTCSFPGGLVRPVKALNWANVATGLAVRALSTGPVHPCLGSRRSARTRRPRRA